MYKTEEIDTPISSRLMKNNIEGKSSHLHHDNGSTTLLGDGEVNTSKPNQVGTVLLYGVPIVSLYIEAQERLCLAQISNTLLKQFSYNEIHNRRVALGITCVQCTPVQLEILRRAGAMPVSSRRCGMITRREAERLCKSFLGDNAPPRLPDDFSFSVFHECAWGCRGQFLPSRYNSSRAKCIKCSYCALFFSPNKFIFHSHRIGPGDKYIQPDAANFNSWRRHMKLSGVSPDEIIHAWEDVKAMFNGGTRKRLMSSVSSASIVAVSSPNSATSSSSSTSNGINTVHSSNIPKRLKESNPLAHQRQISPPVMQLQGSTIASSPNVNQQYPIRPINVHPSKINNGCSRLITSAALCGNSVRGLNTVPSELPPSIQFSRSFMMDYMWHTQQQQHQKHSSSGFQFPGYALPWLKQPSSHMLFNHQNFHHNHLTQTNTNSSSQADDSGEKTTVSCRRNSNDEQPMIKPYSPNSNALQYYKNSAFKPVLTGHRTQLTNDSGIISSSIPVSSNDDPNFSFASDDEYNNNKKCGNNRRNNRRTLNSQNRTIVEYYHQDNTVNSAIGNGVDNISSDEEMVDIETTEDQNVIENITMRRLSNSNRSNHSNHSRESCQSVASVEIDDEIYVGGGGGSGVDVNRKMSENCAGTSLTAIDSDTYGIINSNNNNNNNNNVNHNNNCVPSTYNKISIENLCSDQCKKNKNNHVDDDDNSSNTNCSNIEIVVDSQERDDIKPSVNLPATQSMMIAASLDANCWLNCTSPNKLKSSPILDRHETEKRLETATVRIKPQLKKETLNSSYSIGGSIDGQSSAMKSSISPSLLDLSKTDARNTSELGDTKLNTQMGESSVSSHSLFELKSLKSLDTSITQQTSEIDYRNAVSRTSLEQKFIKSPSPPLPLSPAANLILNNPNLLANRIGQFYPRPGQHAIHNQHHHQHQISKHFHQMLNQHNFLRANSPLIERPTNGSINLSSTQHQPHST